MHETLVGSKRESFGCESCFSGAFQARLASTAVWGPACVASLAAGGFAQRWRLLRRAAVVGFGFVGVAAVYKAQIPRDPTCSAVLHTGTTGSHGERRL